MGRSGTSAPRRCGEAGPEHLAAYVRGRWGIENEIYWVRDVTFRVDASQVRTGNRPRIMVNGCPLADRLVGRRADREAHVYAVLTQGSDVGERRARAPGGIRSDQDRLAVPVLVRGLRKGGVEHLDVIGRRVRPGPTRAHDARGLAAPLDESHQDSVAASSCSSCRAARAAYCATRWRFRSMKSQNRLSIRILD
jgi:hypothetical protein